MRVDQLDEAGRDQIGADSDFRRLPSHHRDFAAEIARAFRSRQTASAPEDPSLIPKILAAFSELSAPRPPGAPPGVQRRARKAARAAAPPPVPAVAPHETIGLGFLTCLEDGVNCRDLGRHLGAAHGLSPDQYRRRWGLPAAYPMVPPLSHEERLAWRRRLAPRPDDDAEQDPSPLRLQEESRRIGAGRSRRQHRRGAPAGLRHDWGKPVPGRRSEGPRPDGFRR